MTEARPACLASGQTPARERRDAEQLNRSVEFLLVTMEMGRIGGQTARRDIGCSSVAACRDVAMVVVSSVGVLDGFGDVLVEESR
jgi:hypothetical protein